MVQALPAELWLTTWALPAETMVDASAIRPDELGAEAVHPLPVVFEALAGHGKRKAIGHGAAVVVRIRPAHMTKSPPTADITKITVVCLVRQ